MTPFETQLAAALEDVRMLKIAHDMLNNERTETATAALELVRETAEAEVACARSDSAVATREATRWFSEELTAVRE